MKKPIILGLALLTLVGVSAGKLVSAENEATSGGMTAAQLEAKGNIQTRTFSNVGGGSWFTSSSLNGKTVSQYYHRDRKHSATVKRGNGTYHKAVRPAGQNATATLPAKSGANSVYWDNSPKEAVGDYRK